MNLYPTEYEVPASKSNYFKPKQGDNVLRILDIPILGWLAWETVNGKDKPKRFRMSEKPVDLRPFKRQEVKHFQAFIVWGYEEQAVQIWEITQKSIMEALQNLYKDEDWGDFREYDLKINRTGEDLDTKYVVSPKPKKTMPEQALTALLDRPVKLEALYEGLDPFDPNVKVTSVYDNDPLMD